MRSHHDEMLALMQLIQQRRGRHLASAPEMLRQHIEEREVKAVLDTYSAGPPQGDEKFCVCRLCRNGVKQLADNMLALCHGCGEVVQHRPDVPAIDKLCVFCALTRLKLVS
jgi:hypothetical protein